MEIPGNLKILSRLIVWLQPVVKKLRRKDAALLRALCALPYSYVKEGSKHHDVLLEHGYSAFEIAYANLMTVASGEIPDARSPRSIVTVKIVVALFQQVLSQKEPFDQKTYDRLSEIFAQYVHLPIRCHGCSSLLQALQENQAVLIQNADTFIWFSKLAPLDQPVFSAFDVMDEKWDALAAGLPEKEYLVLFEKELTPALGKEDIQKRIDRYNHLTGGSYVELYQTSTEGGRFSLLIQAGIMDLWTAFQMCVDETGDIQMPILLNYIKSYVKGIKTIQTFRFFEKFLPKYGFEGYQRYLKPEYDDFLYSTINYDSCHKKIIGIQIERDFLKDNEAGTMTLLQWIEEYIFRYRPSLYFSFVCTILKRPTDAAVVSQETGRALFDLFTGKDVLSTYDVNELKRHYWTPEELEAEDSARKAAALELERKQEQELVQNIQKHYEETEDGTLETLYKFIDNCWHYNSKTITYRTAGEHLPQLLAMRRFVLRSSEKTVPLQICAKLTQFGTMSFSEAQKIISKIKEGETYDAGNDASE